MDLLDLFLLVLGAAVVFVIGVAAGLTVVGVAARVPALGKYLGMLVPGRRGTSPVVSAEALRDLQREAPLAAQQFAAPAAVAPEEVPVEIKPEQVTQIEACESDEQAANMAARFVRDRDTARVVAALARWKPRRRQRDVDLMESEYEASLERYLNQHGFRGQLEMKPRVQWGAGGDAGGTRTAVPDIAVRGRVLVELKADLMRSDQADRAMGQMLRYLLAWKSRGTAVLAVCGYVAPEIRFLVRTYVEIWRKELGLAVTVFFKRDDGEGDRQVEFLERPGEVAQGGG